MEYKTELDKLRHSCSHAVAQVVNCLGVYFFAYMVVVGSVLAAELKKNINIPPEETINIALEDQVCEIDEDCTFMDTSCTRIACGCGVPVNKTNKEKYTKLLEDCRAKAPEKISCDMHCPQLIGRCMNNRCLLEDMSSQYFPSKGEKCTNDADCTTVYDRGKTKFLAEEGRYQMFWTCLSRKAQKNEWLNRCFCDSEEKVCKAEK